ncbi:MAG TPA: hypothetical protein VLA58_05570 [Chitinophagaceae bacterium]|nr:hypothetical protein [Chitinophagaceae bacterium]
MKKRLYLIVLLGLFLQPAKAQTDSTTNKWEVEVAALWYIVPYDQFVLPIVKADKGRLHLEGRFNYEDRNTVSFFGGYNFRGGGKINYQITPMLGLVTGRSDGIAPGLEASFALGKFELYSEMEYLFEFNDKANSYYYNWTELNFYPVDWLWVGITGQRTRAYQSALEIQRGILTGFSWKKMSVTGYLFNPWMEDTFGILSVAWQF